MSFNTFKRFVEEGDTVVLYLGKQSMLSFEIDPSKTHQTKFGAFPHQDMIGKQYGTKIYSKNKKGFVYILHPTPELWTVTLPHRTQILYTTDISQITLELELKPGSIVVESGTGSGSLSHAIIRTIKPTGHLYTFDFHEQRAQKAREEFNRHGVGEFVTSQCADACREGFDLEDIADAVFLDLPAPWDAIPHAKKALKKSGGRLCSFSPCIEQVQRACAVLRKLGFCEIKTIECLLRNLNVRTTPMMEANISIGVDKFKSLKEEKEGEPQTKKQKICQDTDERGLKYTQEKDEINERDDQQSTQFDKVTGLLANGMVSKLTASTRLGNINVLTCKPTPQMPGHTGYLTFASLYPINVDITPV